MGPGPGRKMSPEALAGGSGRSYLGCMSSVQRSKGGDMRDISIKATLWMGDFVHALKSNLRREDGQVATEYLGVIVVIAAIIAALVGSGLANDLANFVKSEIAKVAK